MVPSCKECTNIETLRKKLDGSTLKLGLVRGEFQIATVLRKEVFDTNEDCASSFNDFPNFAVR